MVRFVDDGGLNPLPPGTQVLVYPIGVAQDSSTLVDSAFVELDGLANLELTPGMPYAVAFLGTQAPTVGVAIATSSGGDTVVSIPKYHTPEGWLSTNGSSAAQQGLWPKGPGSGWFGPSDDGLPAPERNLAAAFGGIMGTDVEQTTRLPGVGRNLASTLLSMRLDTAFGNDLDSFALDFLGTTLQRQTGETDDAFRAAIKAALIPCTLTLASIQLVCNAWAVYYALRTGQPQPDVIAADKTSDPARCAAAGVTQNEILIAITFYASASTGTFLDRTFYLDHTYLGDLSGYETATSIPDPRLDYFISLKRAAGKKPIYVTRQLFSRF